MGRKDTIIKQNPQEVSGRVRSCAVYNHSGGVCICYNYGVCSGSKMTRKWDTIIFGRKMEAENGIEALRDRLNIPCPHTRTASFTRVLPKWDAEKIATFRAMKSGLGLSNILREY